MLLMICCYKGSKKIIQSSLLSWKSPLKISRIIIKFIGITIQPPDCNMARVNFQNKKIHYLLFNRHDSNAIYGNNLLSF